MNTITHSRLIALALGITMTVVACADEPKVENRPLRVEAKNVLTARGALVVLHATAEVLPSQLDRTAGITATVSVANQGTEPVEIINPALTTKMELTSNGRRIEVVPAGPSLDSEVAKVVTIASGETHRFDVAVREVYERTAAPAAATNPAPAPDASAELPESGTMSSLPEGAERDATRAERVRLEPLAPGSYTVRLRIGLAQPPNVPDATLRYLLTDPVTVSYGTNSVENDR